MWQFWRFAHGQKPEWKTKFYVTWDICRKSPEAEKMTSSSESLQMRDEEVATSETLIVSTTTMSITTTWWRQLCKNITNINISPQNQSFRPRLRSWRSSRRGWAGIRILKWIKLKKMLMYKNSIFGLAGIKILKLVKCWWIDNWFGRRINDIVGDMQDIRDEGLHSLNELKWNIRQI